MFFVGIIHAGINPWTFSVNSMEGCVDRCFQTITVRFQLNGRVKAGNKSMKVNNY
jgi:hypothetical protein